MYSNSNDQKAIESLYESIHIVEENEDQSIEAIGHPIYADQEHLEGIKNLFAQHDLAPDEHMDLINALAEFGHEDNSDDHEDPEAEQQAASDAGEEEQTPSTPTTYPESFNTGNYLSAKGKSVLKENKNSTANYLK